MLTAHNNLQHVSSNALGAHTRLAVASNRPRPPRTALRVQAMQPDVMESLKNLSHATMAGVAFVTPAGAIGGAFRGVTSALVRPGLSRAGIIRDAILDDAKGAAAAGALMGASHGVLLNLGVAPRDALMGGVAVGLCLYAAVVKMNQKR